MSNFCFLNLNVPLFKDSITYEDLPKNSITIVDKEKIINEQILDFFRSLKLKVRCVEIFYKEPGKTGGIHTDVVGGDYTKINWVFGGSGSQMCWFEPKPNLNKKVSLTPARTPYLSFHETEVIEIERTPIINPTLIQVGVPHTIINVTESRYCVSFIFVNEDDKRLTMEQSIEIFKDYITGSE